MALIPQNEYWSVYETEKDKFNLRLESSSIEECKEDEVIIESIYSSINYRDILACKGNKGVARRFPYTPGVDIVGKIYHSESKNFKVGDIVFSHAAGDRDLIPGGWSRFVKAKSSTIKKIPESLDSFAVAIIGTAGLAAALGIISIQLNVNLDQDKEFDILITGASGGVGSIGVMLASEIGWNVTASSRDIDHNKDYLEKLGAKNLLSFKDLTAVSNQNLLRSKFNGVLDTLGGNSLTSSLRQLKNGGSLSSAGLVLSQDLDNLTVLPFLMRGNSICGTGAEVATKWKLDKAEKLISEYTSLKKLQVIQSKCNFNEINKYFDQDSNFAIGGRTVIIFD